jgi:hypothetical protein
VKVPGELKVKEKLCPAFTVPESQRPVSDVLVCGMFVVTLVQVTVVPTVMVIGSGTKRRVDVIDTAWVVAALAGVTDPRKPKTTMPQAIVRAIAKTTLRAETRMSQPSHGRFQRWGIHR